MSKRTKIAVIGAGCFTCERLHRAVLNVVKDKNIDADVEYAVDINRIVKLGLMISPVLTVDNVPIPIRSTSEKDVKKALISLIRSE